MADRILLVGMMGSGKTTVGRLLARRLGWGYVDSDEQVCRATGRTVREIFESEGEPAFRAEEQRALALATSGPDPVVVGVAGGAVLDPDTRRRLGEAGRVVWLDAPPGTLARRVAPGADHRPLLGGDAEAVLRRLDGERRAIYAGLADVRVEVADRSPAEVVEAIVEALA